MPAFDQKHIDAALARVPAMGAKELRELRARADDRGLEELADACRKELAHRGSVELSDASAREHAAAADTVSGLSLAEAVRHAFTVFRPANADESRFLRWAAANPGGSYRDAEAVYGKGDLGLVIGHIVYDRFGCFRQFMEPGADQSSVLLNKDRSGSSVRYTLKPDVRDVLSEIGVL